MPGYLPLAKLEPPRCPPWGEVFKEHGLQNVLSSETSPTQANPDACPHLLGEHGPQFTHQSKDRGHKLCAGHEAQGQTVPGTIEIT